MKKLVLAISLIGLFTASCNSDSAKADDKKGEETSKESSNSKDLKSLITGTWALDFDATLAQLPEDKKASLDDVTLKMLKEEYSKMDITFNKNGKYEVAGNEDEEESEKPTWTINGNNVEVKRGERVSKYEVKELSESKLILFSDTKGMIFPTSVYTKK